MLEVALAIPYWLELAATISGAIFGALSAVRAKYDIFGVCCIAIVVGLAGGITRDILLQDYGIYAFQKPNLILACIAAGIVVFYFGKLMTYFDPLMDFLDNLSVALWAIIGTGKALSAGLDLVPAVILGTVTANGGGIVRDICMNREPEAFQAGTVYVSAALIGALAFAVMKSNHLFDQYAAITCVALVMGIRYASLAFGWRTRPARDYSDVVTQAVAQPVKRMASRVRARRRPTGFQAQTTGLTGPIPPVTAKGVTGSMPPITSLGTTGSMAPITADGSSSDSVLGNGVTSTDGENRCYPESDDQPPRPESET